MIVGFLLLSFVLVTLAGVVGIVGWCLDRRDARAIASFRAQQLVAWAKLEAAVIAAERSLGVRHV